MSLGARPYNAFGDVETSESSARPSAAPYWISIALLLEIARNRAAFQLTSRYLHARPEKSSGDLPRALRVKGRNLACLGRCSAPEPTSLTSIAIRQPRRTAYSRIALIWSGSVC